MPYKETTEDMKGTILPADSVVVHGVRLLTADSYPLNVEWDIPVKLVLRKGDRLKLNLTVTF